MSHTPQQRTWQAHTPAPWKWDRHGDLRGRDRNAVINPNLRGDVLIREDYALALEAIAKATPSNERQRSTPIPDGKDEA